MFDNHQRFRKRGPAFYDRMAVGLPSIKDVIPNIRYQNDEDFPGLQAADLFAWQIRRAFSVTTEPRRRHCDEARRQGSGHPLFELVLTREVLAEYMRAWNEHLLNLAVGMGFRAEPAE